MKLQEGVRQAHPERGENPDTSKGEVGFTQCGYGHIGQTFVIADEENVTIPKGKFNPYCIGCIMMWVIQRAKLKPNKFFIASREAVEQRQTPQANRPEILIPQQGLVIPEGLMPQPRGHRG